MTIPKRSMLPLHYDNRNRKSAPGFILLLSILLIGAVGLAIVISIILLGTNSSRASFTLERSNYAKAIANACVEEALEQIRDSTSFTGSGSISLGQGTCSYTVTSQGGQNRTITASSTISTLVRKTKAIVSSITPAITLTSWQELSDF